MKLSIKKFAFKLIGLGTLAALALFASACKSTIGSDAESEEAAIDKTMYTLNADTETANPLKKLEPLSIRFSAFNMKYALNDEDWKPRMEMIMPLCKFYDMDIIGSSELSRNQIEYLAKNTKEYRYIQDHLLDNEYDSDNRQLYVMNNPIWFKKTRFDLLQYGTFWFGPEALPTERKTGGWGSGQNRFCVWAKFYDKMSGYTIFVFNVHWNNNSAVERYKSAEVLETMVDKIAGSNPYFVIGDFNALDDEDCMRYIEKNLDLKNSRLISITPHYGPEGSLHDGRGKVKFGHIDHVMVPDISKVIRCGNVSDHKEGIYPSNHFPYLADVLFIDK